MTVDDRGGTKPGSPSTDAGSLTPFRYPAFAVLWIATVISNIGAWMQSAGAGWLMTTLDPDPFTVSLVQVNA
jgi:Transmembrane secretion effector